MTAHTIPLDPSAPPPGLPPPPAPRQRTPVMRVFGVLAVVFALAVVAWGCWSLVDLLALRTYHSTTTLPIVHLVELRADDADVTLIPDATGRIVVERTIERGLRHADAQALERDGRLVVSGGCRGPFGWHCSVSFTIHVPTDVDVIGQLRDGNLSDQGTHGSVQVSSGDGDLDLDGVDGTVVLHTGDGDVHVEALTASSVTASSGDGDLDIELASPPASVALHSGDGDVDVCLPRSTPPYAVNAHTGDGSLNNQIPSDPGAPRTMTVTTGDGDAVLHLC